MRVANITNSLAEDGIIVPSFSVYFAGCDKPIKCKNCHNKELQKFNCCDDIADESVIEYMHSKIKNWFDFGGFERLGVAFMGGEPMAKPNREDVLKLSKFFKEAFNEKIITILYSWRSESQLKGLKLYLDYIDLGVLGPYIEEKNDDEYFLGSTNQYVYNFKTQEKYTNRSEICI